MKVKTDLKGLSFADLHNVLIFCETEARLWSSNSDERAHFLSIADYIRNLLLTILDDHFEFANERKICDSWGYGHRLIKLFDDANANENLENLFRDIYSSTKHLSNDEKTKLLNNMKDAMEVC
jgi:hypothetical protein